MARNRPFGLLMVSILLLTWGGIGLSFTFCGSMQALAQRMFAPSQAAAQGFDLNQLTQRVQDGLVREVPGYVGIMIGSLVVNYALDFLLLAGGVGVLMMRPWGRALALVYVAISLVYRAATLTLQFTAVLPALEPILAAELRGAPDFLVQGARFGQVFQVWSQGCFQAVTVFFPLTVFYVLIQPWVGQAFLDWERAGKQEQEKDREDQSPVE